MKKLVIYDSYYGNTAVIAEKIAQELECEHVKVHAIKFEHINDYDLLVIGSPTRMFSPTKEIKKCVKAIKKNNIKVALFDTRVKLDEKVPKFLKVMANKFGYCNDTLEKVLTKKAITPIVDSGMFYVQDSEGPLFETEIENAVKFTKSIKEKIN